MELAEQLMVEVTILSKREVEAIERYKSLVGFKKRMMHLGDKDGEYILL